MQQINKIPVLQFRINTLIGYESYINSGVRRKHSQLFNLNWQKLIKREKYSGMMTEGARKRFLKAVSLMLQASPVQTIHNRFSNTQQSHKLSFITLTMPDVKKAKTAKWTHKNLLERMLRVLRRRYNMKMYVWKCELQENGSVHYHLTSDCFILFSELREEWNNILRVNGMLTEFEEEYKHSNPNSVDVKKVKNIKDLGKYLLKYVAKETQNQISINAKVWDCSLNLKSGKYFSTEACQYVMQKINELVEAGKVKVKVLEHCTIYSFTHSNLHLYFRSHIKKLYYEHLTNIRSQRYEKENVAKVVQGFERRIEFRGKEQARSQIGWGSSLFGYA